jgi:hypothetical protein
MRLSSLASIQYMTTGIEHESLLLAQIQLTCLTPSKYLAPDTLSVLFGGICFVQDACTMIQGSIHHLLSLISIYLCRTFHLKGSCHFSLVSALARVARHERYWSGVIIEHHHGQICGYAPLHSQARSDRL